MLKYFIFSKKNLILRDEAETRLHTIRSFFKKKTLYTCTLHIYVTNDVVSLWPFEISSGTAKLTIIRLKDSCQWYIEDKMTIKTKMAIPPTVFQIQTS